MKRIMLKSKIHRARVSGVNLDYEGSICIDKKLMEEANLLLYEQVEVLNINNGARFTTYVIEGPQDSGEIALNGAAARLAKKGDIVIIVAYCSVDEEETARFMPQLVYVNEFNRITHTNNTVDNVMRWQDKTHAN